MNSNLFVSYKDKTNSIASVIYYLNKKYNFTKNISDQVNLGSIILNKTEYSSKYLIPFALSEVETVLSLDQREPIDIDVLYKEFMDFKRKGFNPKVTLDLNSYVTNAKFLRSGYIKPSYPITDFLDTNRKILVLQSWERYLIKGSGIDLEKEYFDIRDKILLFRPETENKFRKHKTMSVVDDVSTTSEQTLKIIDMSCNNAIHLDNVWGQHRNYKYLALTNLGGQISTSFYSRNKRLDLSGKNPKDIALTVAKILDKTLTLISYNSSLEAIEEFEEIKELR